MQRGRTRPLELERLQPLAQARLCAPARRKEGERRIDEGSRQAARRHQRMAGGSAGAEASRAKGAASAADPSSGSVLSAGEQ